jgi:acetyl esterase/lipase
MNHPNDTPVIPVWPGVAPGSEGWTQQEQMTNASASLDITVVRNVTRPTLTAHLPEPGLATGAAVIVCPGGAFHFLAIEHEGTDVARWLTVRGVAAFILKYRLAPTPAADEDFLRQLQERFADRERLDTAIAQIRPLTIADGRQAVRVVRQRAAEWGVASARIGIMGFSAGGTVAAGAAFADDADSRPDFAAPIYAAPWELPPVPAGAPPLFLAVADDDPFAVSASVPLYLAWKGAGHSAELHIYARGGHGFGMRAQGLPADHWIDRFGEWLRALERG